MALTDEQQTRTNTIAVIEKTNSRRLMQWGAYALITVLAYLLISVIFKTLLYPYRDAGVYLLLADKIKQNGLFVFYDDVRTYGYPLFLTIIKQVAATIAPAADPLEIIIQVQFVFHTGTALLAVALLDKLSERKTSFTLRLICFALIELNVVLLGLTRDILTDSITVFLVTLLVWLLISAMRFKWLFIGLVLAVSIVVRPFNQVWGLLFLGTCGSLLFARQVLQHGLQSTIDTIRQTGIKRPLLIGLQVLMPLLIIVGLQYWLIFQVESRVNLVGKLATQIADWNSQAGVFYYKYETFAGDQSRSSSVFYVFDTGAKQAAKLRDAAGNMSILNYALTHPVDTAYVFLVKAIGLFQSYELSTYRMALENTANFVFVWGFIPLLGLVYAHWSVLLNVRKMLTGSRAAFYGLIVLAAADLYLILYTIFTIPETRFMAPVFPALTVCGIVAATTQRRRNLLFAAILTFGIYLLAFEILRVSWT